MFCNHSLNRRKFLKKSLCGTLMITGGMSLEEKLLIAGRSQLEKNPHSGHFLNNKVEMPTGMIGAVSLSRIIAGGNLIGGVAHARDLIYLSPLLRNYFTPDKIIDTWQKCEEHGINTMSAWPSEKTLKVLNMYWHKRGGKIQWLGHAGLDEDYKSIKSCIDNGACGIYIAGDYGDRYVYAGELDKLGKALSFIKQNGLFSGVAGHPIKVPQDCENAGLEVDFYMKTLHHGNYWSVTPKEDRKYNIRFGDPAFDKSDHASGYYHDNIWCIDPEGTIEYMQQLKKPWMAFKVLAAGAIPPKDGFQYAFENGADFIHVGMFDFQVQEDAVITKNILAQGVSRNRPWWS